MSADGDTDGGRVEILELAAAFYEGVIWESDNTRAIRGFFAERGLEPETLRAFQVGFAPTGWFDLQEHMRRSDCAPAELRAAGLVQRSHRSDRHYDYFRSRIMFPIRDSGGGLLGFAGLALHPGPSWPKWLTSPEGDRYRRGAAIFAIDRAAPAIRRAGRAVVFKDPLDVLEHHQEGRHEAVAVILSRITREHVNQLATYTGTTASITVAGSPSTNVGALLDADSSPRPSPSAAGVDAAAEPAAEHRDVRPYRRAAAIALVSLMAVLSFALWTAIPVGWLWIGSQLTEDPKPDALVYLAVGSGILISMVAGGYLLLRFNRLYMRLMGVRGGPRVHAAWLKSLRTSDETHSHGVVETVLVVAAVTASVAMAVWFFLFAEVPT